MISTQRRSTVTRVLCRALVALLAIGVPGAGAWQVDPGTAVSLSTDPAGAAVYVDGQARGVTPVELSLPPGEHRVRLAKDGYLENSRVVRVTGTAMAPVRVSLTRAAQVEEPPKAEEGGGGSKKWLFIGLGVAAVGAAAYLVASGGNKAPTAGTVSATPSGNALQGATAVSYSASGASDPDGDPLTFSWNFGDGATGSGSPFSHTFATSGSFNVQVTVSDGKASATAGTTTTVRNLAGAWAGSVTGFPFSFNLAHNGSTISGNYNDADGPGTVSGTVTNPRAVRLTVNQPQFSPFTFTGNADESLNTITGTIEGFPFTMTRR
jgi:hypothetical protein